MSIPIEINKEGSVFIRKETDAKNKPWKMRPSFRLAPVRQHIYEVIFFCIVLIVTGCSATMFSSHYGSETTPQTKRVTLIIEKGVVVDKVDDRAVLDTMGSNSQRTRTLDPGVRELKVRYWRNTGKGTFKAGGHAMIMKNTFSVGKTYRIFGLEKNDDQVYIAIEEIKEIKKITDSHTFAAGGKSVTVKYDKTIYILSDNSQRIESTSGDFRGSDDRLYTMVFADDGKIQSITREVVVGKFGKQAAAIWDVSTNQAVIYNEWNELWQTWEMQDDKWTLLTGQRYYTQLPDGLWLGAVLNPATTQNISKEAVEQMVRSANANPKILAQNKSVQTTLKKQGLRPGTLEYQKALETMALQLGK